MSVPSSKEFDYIPEEFALKDKKLSREERKIEQAMKLFEKLENNNTPGVQKQASDSKSTYNTTSSSAPKPRKKVKQAPPISDTQTQLSDPLLKEADHQSSCPALNAQDLESSSVSDNTASQPKPAKPASQKKLKLVTSLYKLDPSEDLYTHLLDYEREEKDKFTQALASTENKTPLLFQSAEVAAEVSKVLKVLSAEQIQRTSQAFKKLQSKFEENKDFLSKLDPREHEEFNKKYVRAEFLLGP